MITPTAYLRCRYWRFDMQAGAWVDPHSGDLVTLDEAVAIQVRRDADCEAFRRDYQARAVLRECAEHNRQQVE